MSDLDRFEEAFKKIFMAQTEVPMNQRQSVGIVSRDQLFIQEHKDTHITLPQAVLVTGIHKNKLLTLLPPPDKVSPYGKRTRLWKRETLAGIGNG